MRKARVPASQLLTFKEYLDKFEPTVLQGAVVQLEGSIAWQLMTAFLKLRQRQFEVASLDFAGHSGKSSEAAKASGYALACEDVANTFMQELIDSVEGKDGLVEGPEREEDI